MTVRRSGEMKAMDSPPDPSPRERRRARCDDVTSLDSWGELDQSPNPLYQAYETRQLSNSTRDQKNAKPNRQKQKADGRSSASNSHGRKPRSNSALANSSSSSSNASFSASSSSYNDENLKVRKSNQIKTNVSGRYTSDNPVTLNPEHLEYMNVAKSSNSYNLSDKHKVGLYPSLHSVNDGAGPSYVPEQTVRLGTLEIAKWEYSHRKSQSHPGHASRESAKVKLKPDTNKMTADKHRSSESIYSSTEQSQNSGRGHRGNDFGGDLDQLLEQSEKVKTKLLSMWNNVKYGWTIKTKTQFRFDSPIYLLGKCYHIRKEEDVENDTHQPHHHRPTHPQISYRMTEMEAFKRDFTSRLWFTYRRDFPQLPKSTLTTDCGWGCMLRSGQMMLAQAFTDHFLSRDWRLFNSQSSEQDLYHKQIIRWFGDYPSNQSPFSIHSLVQLGEKSGKRPGDWYGPASVAHILKDAISNAYEYQPILSDIAVYVSQDCTVYKQDIMDACSVRHRSSTRLSSSVESPTSPLPTGGEREWKRGVVILIPVRLGSDSLNPVYIPCLKSLLAQDCCLGIIGGKPKHSLYFIGWQEDKLIHLDPHYCQDVVDTRERDFPSATFHCMSPRKMPFSKMDPSCTIGFYCKTKADFNKFVEQTEEMVLEPKYKGLYPMFIFADGSSSDINLDGLSVKEDKLLRVRHINTTTTNGRPRSMTVESEEFVFL